MEQNIVCERIYKAALALINEPDNGNADDYAERAPYLLAAFCGEAGGIDAAYRKSKGLPSQPSYGSVMIGLEESFPLSNRFAGAAALYLAAMLVIDENEELSDRLYGRYCDRMSKICSEIPGVLEKITDIYGY